MLDENDNLHVPMEEFVAAASRMGFEEHAAELFKAFDLNNSGKIFEEDMRFLERWKPRAFLTAEPSPAAAEQVKSRRGTWRRKGESERRKSKKDENYI